MKNLQYRIWEIVEAAKPGDNISRCFDIFILLLIFLNVLAVIFGSVQTVQSHFRVQLIIFETISVIIFFVEYLLRLWSCIKSSKYQGKLLGRLKFIFSFMALVDLLAILPFFMPFLGIDLRFVRAFRLLRIIRIAKVGRYYSSLKLIKNVFQSKKEELILSTFVMVLLLILSSCIMFYLENEAQPEAFSNIPKTMWWSVVTLTTVGYGDVYPVTVGGKILASIIAILGIGMFALPTGIIGAGFVEEIECGAYEPKEEL